MNGADRVLVLRVERTEPVHISEVISELLPELDRRPEPEKIQLSRSGLYQKLRIRPERSEAIKQGLVT